MTCESIIYYFSITCILFRIFGGYRIASIVLNNSLTLIFIITTSIITS